MMSKLTVSQEPASRLLRWCVAMFDRVGCDAGWDVGCDVDMLCENVSWNVAAMSAMMADRDWRV
jgi:hypothetical protein